MSFESFSVELFLKNLSLLDIDPDIKKEGVLKDESLLYVLECLVLRMECLSSYLSTIVKRVNTSHSSETHDLLSIACGSETIKDYYEEFSKSLQILRLLINTLNATIRLYDQNNPNDCALDVSNKLWRFMKFSFKALAIFTMLCRKYGFPAEYHETTVKQTEKLAAILIVGKQYRVVFIFVNYLSSLLKHLKENAVIKLFLICLLGHAKTSEVVSLMVLKYISSKDTMKIIGDYSSEASCLLSLFADVLQSMLLFPNHSHVQQRYIRNIIRYAVELIPSATQPNNYLYILKSVFTFLSKKTINPSSESMCFTIPTVLKTLDVLLQSPPRCDTGSKLIETFLFISQSLLPTDLLPYCRTFVKVILYSLNREDIQLASLALSVFENLQEHVSSDYINSEILPLKQDFLLALYGSLQSPHKELNEKAFSILGKLGAFNRDMFNKPIKVKEVNSSCSLFLNFKNRGSINLPLSKIIVDFAFRDILKDHVGAFTKKQWWYLIKILLKQYLRSHKELVLQSSTSSLSDAERYLKGTNIDSDSSEVISLADCAFNASFEIYKIALTAMFVAEGTPELSDLKLEDFVTKTLDAVIENLIFDNVQGENDHLVLFIDAVMEAVSLPKSSRDNFSIDTIKRIIDTASRLKPEKVWCSALMKYMIKQITILCYHQHWEAKLAGCKAMSYVWNKITHNLKVTYIQDFLKALLSCLTDSYKKISFGVIKEARSVLKEIFLYIEEELDKTEFRTEIFENVSKMLVEELRLLPNMAARDLIRYCICDLYRIFKRDLKDLKFPLKFLEDADFLIILHEDLNFCKQLNFPLLKEDSTQKIKHRKILYEKIKLFCSPGYDYDEDTVPSHSEVSRKICGALYTLCFNFVEEKTAEELFEIFTRILLCFAPEVSEAASICLNHMSENYKDMIANQVNRWEVNFLQPLKMKHPLEQHQFTELSTYLRSFPTSEGDLNSKLMMHFRGWKKLFTQQCLEKSASIVPFLEIGTLLLQCISALPMIDESCVDEVLSFMVELQGHLLCPMSTSLKGPLIKLCTKFPSKSIFMLFSKLEGNTNTRNIHIQCTTLLNALMKDENIFLNELLGSDNKMLYLKKLKFHELTELLSCALKYNKIMFKDSQLKEHLLDVWNNVKFSLQHSRLKTESLVKGLKVLAKSLLSCFIYMPKDFQILFDLMKAFNKKQFFYNFQFLKDFINTQLPTYRKNWEKAYFQKFHSIFLKDHHHPAEVEIFQFIILPLFQNVFKEGRGKAFLLSKINKNDNSQSILDLFLDCLNNLSQHTKEMIHAFMGLVTLLIACFEFLKEEKRLFHELMDNIKRFAESLKDHYKSLFLLMIECQETNANIENLQVLSTDLIKNCPVQEKHVVRQIFYFCASKLSAEIFFVCFKDYFKQNHFEKCILKLIVAYPKNFDQVHQNLVECVLRSALHGKTLTNLKDIKISVNLISVVINWRVTCLRTCITSDKPKFLVSTDDTNLMLNLLFEIACIPHSNALQKSLSNKCNSLLNTIFEEEKSQRRILLLEEFKFKTWVNKHIEILVNKPREFLECYSLFTLMKHHLPCMPVASLKSFLDYVHDNFQLILDLNETRIIRSVCEFMFNLLKKFPPESYPEFHNLYKDLNTFCSDASEVTFIYCSGKMIINAVGIYFPAYLKKLKESSSFYENLYKSVKSICKKKEYYKFLELDVAFNIMEKIFGDIKGEHSKLFLFESSPLANESDEELIKKIPVTKYTYSFLFEQLPLIIESLTHPDITLKMINFINFVTFEKCRMLYKNTNENYPKKMFHQVLVLLEKICVAVGSVKYNQKIKVTLFEILVKLRTSVKYKRLWQKNQNQLIEVCHMWWNDKPKQFIEVDAHIISTLFFTANVFYSSENYQKFFQIVAEELQHDVYAGIMHIFEMKINDSYFWINHCLTLMGEMVQNVSLHHDNIRLEEDKETKDAFFAVMEICHRDKHLAEHVWMQLFPGLWSILKKSEQQSILTGECTEPFRKRLCSKQLTISPNADDIFVTAALKCDPAFYSFIMDQHIYRAFYLRILSNTVENHMVLLNSFSHQHEFYYRTLNKIYITLEEDDLRSALMQNLFPYSIKPVSELQEGNIEKSHQSYLDLLNMMRNSTSFSNTERVMYLNQVTNCAKKLAKWKFFATPETETLHLSSLVGFFKGNGGITSKAFKSLTNDSDSSEMLPSTGIQSAVAEIINTWKCLPQVFPSSSHYSLLQIIQQVTELREITALDNQIDTGKCSPSEISQKVQTLCCQRQEFPYLLSDNPEFIAELFLARYTSLKSIQEKFSLMPVKSSEPQHKVPGYVSKIISHTSYDSLINMSSIALKFEDIYLKDIRLKNYSAHHAFKIIELKFLALLSKARKSSHLTEEERYDLMKKTDALMKLSITKSLNDHYKGVFGAYCFDIANELEYVEQYVDCKSYLYPDSSRLWELQSQMEDYLFRESHNPIHLRRVILSSLKACKYGDTLVAIKQIPEILVILENVEEEWHGLIALTLLDYYDFIPAKHWLLFLPFLTSCLYHSLIKEKRSKIERKRKLSFEVKKKLKLDGKESNKFEYDEEKEPAEDEKPTVSSVITLILIEIGKTYSQDVFFAIQSLREIEKEIIREDNISMHTKYLQIVASLRRFHPSLISKLEEMLQNFSKISPCVDHLEFKQILEKAYYFVYMRFMEDNSLCSTEELIYYLEKKKKDFFKRRFSDNEKFNEALEKLFDFQSLRFCSPETIINQMKKIRFVLSKLNLKNQRHFMLKEKCSFFSCFQSLGEEKIDVFGQSPSSNYKSHVKLNKILPKCEMLKWNGDFGYKISMLGDDGKVYPFIVLKNFSEEESLMHMRCVQALENLSLIFEENPQISKCFFHFYFPRLTSIRNDLMLMPLQYSLVPYEDIYRMKSSSFGEYSQADTLFTLFYKNMALSQNSTNREDIIVQSLELIKAIVPDDTFIKWVKTLYPSPTDYYTFKQQFVKQLSLLFTIEYFFNMHVTKQLLISRDSGLVTASYLQVNSKQIITTSRLLSPNICKFIEPFGINEIIEKLFRLFLCLKENKSFMLRLLQLMKRKDFSKEEKERSESMLRKILDKLYSTDRDKVQRFIQLSTVLHHSPIVNPFLDMKF